VTVERTTALAAPAERVWARVTTFAGVNDELRPWLRMTAPRRLRDASLDDVELGRPVCRSWVLLGGVVPVEYDDVTLVERGPGMRFLERSLHRKSGAPITGWRRPQSRQWPGHCPLPASLPAGAGIPGFPAQRRAKDH
jgi:hypothetical protein